MNTESDILKYHEELQNEKMLLGRLRTMAAEIGKDQDLAVRFWSSGTRNHRLLSLLIFDTEKVEGSGLDGLTLDIENGRPEDQTQLCDWLMSNVIMKNPRLKQQVELWATESSVIRQRLYWQLQARTTKSEDKEKNLHLLQRIETELESADSRVQWTMNWCAASIGIEDETLRERCIALGERTGLYKEYPTPKGCTSPYLPSWIAAVAGKRSSKKR